VYVLLYAEGDTGEERQRVNHLMSPIQKMLDGYVFNKNYFNVKKFFVQYMFLESILFTPIQSTVL